MNRMSNNTTLCSTLYNYHANIKKVHQIQLSQYYLFRMVKHFQTRVKCKQQITIEIPII